MNGLLVLHPFLQPMAQWLPENPALARVTAALVILALGEVLHRAFPSSPGTMVWHWSPGFPVRWWVRCNACCGPSLWRAFIVVVVRPFAALDGIQVPHQRRLTNISTLRAYTIE